MLGIFRLIFPKLVYRIFYKVIFTSVSTSSTMTSARRRCLLHQFMREERINKHTQLVSANSIGTEPLSLFTSTT
jgi:hypothetical protein